MIKGFKNFLMRGELIVIAVGLVVALAFSSLITSFTTNIITPLINSLAGTSANSSGRRLDDQRTVHRARCVHLGDYLLRHLHGRRLFRARRAVSLVHGATRHGGLRGTDATATREDVSRVPLGGRACGRHEVLALRERHRLAEFCSAIARALPWTFGFVCIGKSEVSTSRSAHRGCSSADRASVFGTECRGFKSLQPHQLTNSGF